jgi:hypothetical protein
MAPDTKWQVYREYYCPVCATQHDVEAPTPWYPVVHDFEPDIDTFYKEWLGRRLKPIVTKTAIRGWGRERGGETVKLWKSGSIGHAFPPM